MGYAPGRRAIRILGRHEALSEILADYNSWPEGFCERGGLAFDLELQADCYVFIGRSVLNISGSNP
jgi:hypothetical protein